MKKLDKINIIKMTHYRDGGTLSFRDENDIEYCRDGRYGVSMINIDTLNKWFLGYPLDDKSNMIIDENIILQLEEFAKNYKGL